MQPDDDSVYGVTPNKLNVNFSVGTSSFRDSRVSDLSNQSPLSSESKLNNNDNEQETILIKPKSTQQLEPEELEGAKGCGKRTCMFTKYAI